MTEVSKETIAEINKMHKEAHDDITEEQWIEHMNNPPEVTSHGMNRRIFDEMKSKLEKIEDLIKQWNFNHGCNPGTHLNQIEKIING